MIDRLDLRRRVHAAGIHLFISAGVAILAALLVFGLWFPGIYRQIAGGRDLFLLVTSVDVVLGPLLTFAVFNVKKGRTHLRQDLAIIGVIQMAALIYGMSTVSAARPVAMVFETDRFRVIAAAQVEQTELADARPEYRTLPLTGQWLLGTRTPLGAERNDVLFKGLNGMDLAQRPRFWQPYTDSVADALARSRPIAILLARYPLIAPEIRAKLRELGVEEDGAKFLPLVGRGGDWVTILDAAGRPVHFVRADGFF